MLQFAREINATVTAEGIETATELVTLRTLGVPWGRVSTLGTPSHSTPVQGRYSQLVDGRRAGCLPNGVNAK
jgi:EAL domain-containing protein (putative c-di-GMP-specific phosphodiesterase class I)